VATATVAYPDDFLAKIRRAATTEGTRFVHLLSPCPPGWKVPSEYAIRYARLAVATRVFPLLEIENGRRWRLTVQPPAQPLQAYLEGQGRFRDLIGNPDVLARFTATVEDRWQYILDRCRASE
jgi:pyruvate/2-oxoacid:ferredoxin oxidoreductase beta subunit